MKFSASIILGDCKDELARVDDNSVALIFTSPPCADSRKNTYGGIHPDRYVEWFLPITKRILKCFRANQSLHFED